jgi:putative Holliday junction resolvase
MTFSRESILIAFWIASLFDLASGYPGMNVFTGVKAMSTKISVQRVTRIVTRVTKRLVLVNCTVKSCLCDWLSTKARRNLLVLCSLLLLLMSAFLLTLHSMDRIIGIDYGRKRVGVAVSDPLGIFASALETVHSAKIIEYLKTYIEKENVVRFVVGYPINMNGKPSEAAKDIDVFLKHLAKAFPDIPVSLEDERFTSVLAHRAMIDGGMKKQDRMKKESVDKISAAIILQSYMDRNK